MGHARENWKRLDLWDLYWWVLMEYQSSSFPNPANHKELAWSKHLSWQRWTVRWKFGLQGFQRADDPSRLDATEMEARHIKRHRINWSALLERMRREGSETWGFKNGIQSLPICSWKKRMILCALSIISICPSSAFVKCLFLFSVFDVTVIWRSMCWLCFWNVA